MAKILVVEDIQDTLSFMKSMLELQGFDVVVAEDGQEGLKQACSESPDLVITDISMPVLSGIDMIKQLRTTPEGKNLPILAITSYGIERAMQAIKVGADRALPRPVENHLLLAFVHDLLPKSL
ncbi:MAG: response regulator [Blastocatellia bacterium]